MDLMRQPLLPRARSLAAVLATAVVAAVFARSAAAQQTPDRPGRAVATDVDDLANDDDLLNATAKDLGVPPPTDRLDQRILKWGGLRPALENAGITFEGVFTGDFSKNLRGGIDTRSEASRYLLDLRLNLDTRAAFGLAGGTFSVDFQQQDGRNGSEELTGDVQGFDNADADGRTQIAEVWYEQLLLDNRVRVKIGKVDANSEFALPENAGGFVNSSYGHSPTLNPWMPTYPDAATSANVFVYPVSWLYAGAGVYDGNGAEDGVRTGEYGPSKLFHSGRSFFYIAEVGAKWLLAENTLPGRAVVGGHYHDGTFGRFDGGTQDGAAGLYAIVEQKLVHPKFYDKGNENGVYAFAQYGHTDGRVTEVTDHYSVGVTWVGPYPKANPDTIGVGVSAARLTEADGAGFTRDFETSIEGWYNFQVTSYLSVKPDLQYIIHPGGDATIGDALAATLRVTLAF
ncbi:MAG: Carbohydrate-selective porin OprB [Phycisphaerales bacterium]|nr:Carbohydrate-selective porin OprB [Phycisphaerales bacterium]